MSLFLLAVCGAGAGAGLAAHAEALQQPGDHQHHRRLQQWRRHLRGRLGGLDRRGVYAGRLRNCGQVEALTANLVSINRRYKAHAGLRITDI